MLIAQSAALSFCLIVSALGLRRAYRLRNWLKLSGTVVGPSHGSGSWSQVRIRFTDPKGVIREVDSGIAFGHSYGTPRESRIPYTAGETVAIRVDPRDYRNAELDSKALWMIPAMLLLMTAYLAFDLLRK